MKKAWILFLCLLVNPAQSDDIALAPGSPTTVGMDANVLQQANTLIARNVADDKLRNVVVLVARRGKIVLHEAHGWKDKDAGIKLRKDALFRIKSNTKPVTATGIALLVDRGAIHFADNASKILPVFGEVEENPITVHHLLTHTSGLKMNQWFVEPLMEKSSQYPHAPSLQLEVNRVVKAGIVGPPGGEFVYSNNGYNALGAIIEVVSGNPLDKFIQDNIFAPLRMQDSYFVETEESLDNKLDRMSVVYYRTEDRWFRKARWFEGWRPGDPPVTPFARGSGGMISTAMDYAVFCQMILNGGIYAGIRVLKPETVQHMISSQVAMTKRNKEEYHVDQYGYGFAINTDTGVFGHGGSDGTRVWIDPANELIVLLFTQSPNGEYSRGNEFYDKVVESIIE